VLHVFKGSVLEDEGWVDGVGDEELAEGAESSEILEGVVGGVWCL